MSKLYLITGLLACALVGMGCPQSGSGDLPEDGQEQPEVACETPDVVCANPADVACTSPPDVVCPNRADVVCSNPADANCPGEPAQDFCGAWESSLEIANLDSLTRFALYDATAIVQGTFGETLEANNDLYGLLTITQIHYGWGFLTGTQVWVRLHPDLEAALPDAQEWVVPLTSHHPSQWEAHEIPVWSNAMTMFPASESSSYGEYIGYLPHRTANIAVVRIIDQDEYRTTFEVLDALKGSFPDTFSDNWYFSWNLPFPDPGDSDDQLYIVSTHGLTEYPDDVVLGTVYDMRVWTPENLANVKNAISNPVTLFEKAQLQEGRKRLHTSLAFHYSPTVLKTLVTGIAGECCTGAGGTFIQHDVADVLKGATDVPWFITGGHAYYGPEQCGDGYLIGTGTLLDPSEIVTVPFDCQDYPNDDWWDAWGPPISSPLSVQLEATPENSADLQNWLASPPPVYQLHPLSAEPEEASLLQEAETALWSNPMDAVTGFMFATHIALFTVEQAVHNPVLDAWEVTISTTFSIHEYDHLEVHQAKLVFRCGDPRLLQEGARLIAPFILSGQWSFASEKEPDYSRMLILPGVLIPESQMTSQLESNLAYYLSKN